MPGPFDNATKRLLRQKPQHFVSWLVPEGTFKRNLSVELKSRNIYADGLFAITVNGQPALLHTEFQTGKDAFTFGGLVSGNEAYDEWFKRSFAMLEDILEESWTYKEIIQKGMQKGIDLGLEKGLERGLEKGREEGLEKGREEERQQWVQEQHQTLLSFVQVRFPELISLAKEQTAAITDPEVLHNLIVKLFGLQTAEEAKQAILETSALT
jgi:predicted transposase YdaD